ncbi:hypothetical protein [Methanobrevibacter sp.]|uniref:hypothetical protein n=1 Tax=Methanobrevibacter sp. TaxID=66852 RepID=UPI0038902890
MKIIEKFNKQHIVVKILDIIFLILFVYEIITFPALNEVWLILILLFIILACQWHFKKED